jgi:CBS domain-containing protein
MLVKDIMSPKLVMVDPAKTVFYAVSLMVENNISGLVVEEQKRAVGILTMKDVARRVIAQDKDVHKTLVADAMSSPVSTINQMTLAEKAASIMGDRKIKRLVVVDDRNKAVGIITTMDIVSHLPNLLDVMFETWVKPEWR